MIDKELEPLVNVDFLDRNQAKGYKSEQKMEFYLQRKFFDNPEIHVLNNLYIKTIDGKGCFQIDHLVVTKYCFLIIESKTCNSHLKFDQHLQWSCYRQTEQKWVGMKSPMKQAEMQGDALRKVLQEKRLELRHKFMLMQGGFLTLPIHTLVAISDSGIIDYCTENENYCRNVLKADLIPNRILEIYESYKKRDSVKNYLLDRNPDYILPDEDIKKVIEYIIDIHRIKPVYREIEDVKIPICDTCRKSYTIHYNGSSKQYELVCKECGSVKKLNFKCQKCQGELKIHKYNETFVVGCEQCDNYGKLIR